MRVLPDINKDLVSSLHTQCPDAEHTSWTTKLDRGGLKYPTRDFFKLIFEMDCIVSSDSSLSAQSLAKDTMIERIMDAVPVKLCWDDICTKASVETSSSLKVLEAVIKAFFVVKGFSIAHRLRQKIVSEQREKMSLRYALKAKGNNFSK